MGVGGMGGRDPPDEHTGSTPPRDLDFAIRSPPHAEAVLNAVMRAMGVEAPRDGPQAPELVLIDEPGIKRCRDGSTAPAEDVELHSAMRPLPSRVCRPGSIYAAAARR
jgi:hypothetical protein